MADAIRLDVTELRLISLERDGQWLLDHHEAEQRDCCANFVDSANHLFADLFKLDRELCGSAIVGRNAAGVPSGLVEVLFLKSYFLALTAERLATWFERKGCPVGGVESLKTWLRELETYNRPSAETPERLEAERQITVAEVVQGKSIVEITTPVMTKVLPKSGKPAKPAQSTWDIVLAGKWYAQSSGNEHAKWRFECHTPAYVVLYEGQDYWLDITEHVDDTAMLGLVQIAGIERIVGLTFDTIQIM